MKPRLSLRAMSEIMLATAAFASLSIATIALAQPAKPPQRKQDGVGPLQPVLHAQAAGVLTCAQGFVKATRGVVDSKHKAVSSWVTQAPDKHVFSSVVALDYPVKAAPKAVAIVAATPTEGKGCDTTSVQVYPTTRSCAAIEEDLAKDGRTSNDLNGVHFLRAKSGFQHLLLPGPGGAGCVIVAVAIESSAAKP